MRCGIVGLPNVGKSTLFNAITRTSQAVAANYPFCTIEPNIAVVPLYDKRLTELARCARSQKTIEVTLECCDIAGLVRGAHKGEGRGSSFLSHIREVDLIIQVVRLFQAPDVMHVDGSLDPLRDMETIEMELVLEDLETLERIKRKPPEVEQAISILKSGASLKGLLLSQYKLLSLKPVIYVLNDSTEHPSLFLKNRPGLVLSAKTEEELSQLPREKAEEFMKTSEIEESGINRLMKKAYEVLNLVTYFTAGPKEARGWTIPRGCLAPQAAGKIHSDFERRFICADTVSWDKFVDAGGWEGCKKKGLVVKKGKTSEICEGEVCLFHLNR